MLNPGRSRCSLAWSPGSQWWTRPQRRVTRPWTRRCYRGWLPSTPLAWPRAGNQCPRRPRRVATPVAGLSQVLRQICWIGCLPLRQRSSRSGRTFGYRSIILKPHVTDACSRSSKNSPELFAVATGPPAAAGVAALCPRCASRAALYLPLGERSSLASHCCHRCWHSLLTPSPAPYALYLFPEARACSMADSYNRV
jgi:hypothetical protein